RCHTTTCRVKLFVFGSTNMHAFIFFFFFSSRRRHTRSKRDWSSDVCSSDLDPYQTHTHIPNCTRSSCFLYTLFTIYFTFFNHCRSEERRVGKDCRSRCSTEQ